MLHYSIIRKLVPRTNRLMQFRTKQYAAAENDEENLTAINEEELLQREIEIENKRNKSRLNPQHYNLLHGVLPYEESRCWIHETVKYKRKMYARYGQASGVNPGICWPTKQELIEMKEYESIAYPKAIPEMMKQIKEEKEAAIAKVIERENDIAKKLAKLEQWKIDLHNKSAKKLLEAQAAKDRKDRLVEEVRRHFGFTVDPKDERFQQMLEKKDKEDKKLQKEAKRKAKEEKMLAKLTGKQEKSSSRIIKQEMPSTSEEKET